MDYLLPSTPADIMRGQITQTGAKTLKPPKSIIMTPIGARYIYNRLRLDHLKRMLRYAQIDGVIAGKPPYDPEQLSQAKLDYVANVNMLDARALYERSAQAYWNLTYQAQTIARIQFITGAPEDIEIENIASQHFHDILMEWPPFVTLKGMNAAQIVKYGLSSVIWPDEESWKWRVVDTSQFYVPDQAQSDIEQLGCLCVETDLTVQYLFQVYDELKDAEDPAKLPWNLDELVYLLLRLANITDKQANGTTGINDLAKRYYDGDSTLASVMSDSVKLVSLYQMEYDGKVSQYMFHPLFSKETFLYKVEKQYKSFADTILIYTASPGEKTIHGNIGVGHKIFTSSQAIMRIDNSVLDAARIASTPILGGAAGGASDIQAIRFYPGVPTYVGAAVMQQNNFGNNINQLVGASQYFVGKQTFNLGNSGDDPAQPDKSMGGISAEQFKFKSIKELAMPRQVIAHYYNSEDTFYQNVVARMLNAKSGSPGYEYAEEWKNRCIKENPAFEEIFKKTTKSKVGILPKGWRARATRVAGDGSAFAALLNLEAFSQLVPGLPAKGVREFNRQAAIYTVGPDHVNSFLDEGTPDEQAGGASLAGVENAMMRLGESPVFSVDNEHRSHYAIHAALAMDTIKSLQEQLQVPETEQTMDPVAADRILNLTVPHMEEHLQAEARGMFGKVWVEQQLPNFKKIQDFYNLNRRNAERVLASNLKKKVEDQEQTQEVMTDAQRKDFQAQSDEKRKTFVLMAKEKRTDEAQTVRAGIMEKKVILDTGVKQLDTLLKNEREVEAATAERIREDIAEKNKPKASSDK